MKIITWTWLSLALAGSCVQVEPQADFDSARALVEVSTGQVDVFDPSVASLTASDLDAILADGLSLDEALRVALLNNRELQAEFQSIGIAHTDWVQAQLLSNPSLDTLLRPPSGGGRTMLEAALGIELLELWRIPARSEAAKRDLEATVLRVARSAGARVADVRQSYYTAAADIELVQVANASLALAQRSFEAAQALREAGSADALEENLARGPLLAAQLALRTAHVNAANSKHALAQQLSLDFAVERIELTDSLPESAASDVDVEALIELAHASRLDLRAIASDVEARKSRMTVEERRAWGDLAVGPSIERQNNGPDLIGATINLTLPIFDQNQAQVARAGFELEQMNRLYEAARIAATRQVRLQASSVNEFAQQLAFYREELLPNGEHSLALANESYVAGGQTLPALLEVQRQLLNARKNFVLKKLAAALATSDLELAVGAPLPAH